MLSKQNHPPVRAHAGRFCRRACASAGCQLVGARGRGCAQVTATTAARAHASGGVGGGGWTWTWTRARTHKSIPIVVMNEGVHESSQKRRRRHDLPTPVQLAFVTTWSAAAELSRVRVSEPQARREPAAKPKAHDPMSRPPSPPSSAAADVPHCRNRKRTRVADEEELDEAGCRVSKQRDKHALRHNKIMSLASEALTHKS